MARYLVLLATVLGCVITDDHGHHAHHVDHAAAAPSSYEATLAPAATYGAPAAPAPSYGAPASEYGAPAAEYGAPAPAYESPSDAYGAPSDAYGVPQQYNEPTGYSDAYAAVADSGFDLSTLSSYLPFFIAVLAAVIVAQLFAPLLGTLSSLDIASAILTPLHSAKLDLVNAVLSPFNLVLGNVGSCTPATGRSLDAGWNMSPDDVLNLMFKANEIYNGELLLI